MALYRLFVDSSNGVDVNPEYDFAQEDEKVERRHRVRSGKEYVYKFGDYSNFKFTVRYVNSEFRSIVNSWWNTNTELLFMEEGGADVYSVRIFNDNMPVSKFEEPYTDLFKGKIELSTY